ncbi:MAG TPA: long-chain fatty acid--CoA ligase [Chthonomonadaceae bacterium]|nr:long-chain fatty acid--CoA ligase [Chthonomonadaceae bacterium]
MNSDHAAPTGVTPAPVEGRPTDFGNTDQSPQREIAEQTPPPQSGQSDRRVRLLPDIITIGAARYGGSVALIDHDVEVSYDDLADHVGRCAAGLTRLGVRAGDAVSLLLPNCPAFVYAYYAAAAIGAVVVPVNPLLKPNELEYIWRDASVRLVVAIPQLLPALLAAHAGLPELRHVVCATPPGVAEDPTGANAIEGYTTLDALMAGPEPDDGTAAANPSESRPSGRAAVERRSENDCAVIIYTSGTTGRPKGAMLSHRNLVRNVEQVRARLHFSEADRFLTVLPLFHAFAATVCMNVCLEAGCASLLLESFAPARVLEGVRRHGITIFPAVPAMLNALLMTARGPEDLGAVRFFVSGGAPLAGATLEALERRFGIPVLEGDGPTECSPVTSVNPMDGPRKAGSVGPPLPGVEIAIFDDEDRALPPETIGEIVVRGDNVMLGYLNQPEATAEAMKGGWYHTGDLGKADSDGYVFIVDRKKDMVITSGLNVYPREVEEALHGHEAVQEAAVIGVPDALRGEAVVAVIVRKSGAEASDRDLLRHCRQLLANYKVPQRVIFRDALPRGGTGKVLKRLLKKELELDNPV